MRILLSGGSRDLESLLRLLSLLWVVVCCIDGNLKLLRCVSDEVGSASTFCKNQ